MRRLVIIALIVFGILLIAFVFWCGFNILNGQPIAHVTGMGASIFRDTLVFLVALAVLVGYVVWLRVELGDWFDFVKWLWKS